MLGQNIGYARVSSLDQNIERQIKQLEKMNLDRIFAEHYSAKNTDRPVLQEMLRFLREGDHLFVHSMDRLARNLVDLRNIVHTLTSSGVKVSFIKENLNFTGADEPISVLLLSVMGGVAEFERAIIRERQSEGIKIAKQKGVYKGRVISLRPEQVEEIRVKVGAGIPKARVAREYKICRETLYKYLRENIVAVS
jgi:DNA invertase Pin-like site-specific DNA recombinase